MIAFIFWCIVALFGTGVLIAGVAGKNWDTDSRVATGAGGALMIALAICIVVFVQMLQSIPVQTIGIVTYGGRPTGHIGTGYSWIPPWDTVASMDEAIQVSDYTGTGCITVRIADQQTACADVTIRWRVNPAGADNVYGNYKNSTSGVEQGLVNPELTHIINNVFETFNPVTSITSPDSPGSPGNPTVGQLGQQVEQMMQQAIGTDVTIVSLFVPRITYDAVVQAKLNSITTQQGSTVVAQEQVRTNQALATSYAAIARILAANPNVLVSQCLQNVEEPLAKTGTVPVGFSCWPGSGSAVIPAVGK